MVDNIEFRLRRRKRSIASAVAGVSAAAVLLSSGTIALWQDAVTLQGGDVVSGNLDAAPLDPVNWADASDVVKTVDPAITPITTETPGTKPIELDTYTIVPGDVIVGNQSVDIALDGDNLQAKIDIISKDAAQGSLFSDSNGVSLHYTVIDTAGKIIVPSTPISQNSTTINLNKNDYPALLDSKTDLKVVFTAVFDAQTPDQIRTQVKAILQSIVVQITQVRGTTTTNTDPDATTDSTDYIDPESLPITYDSEDVRILQTTTIGTDSNGNGQADYGDTVDYEWAITNTSGQVITGNLKPSDPRVQITSGSNIILNPNETIIIHGKCPVDVADITAQQFPNITGIFTTIINNTTIRVGSTSNTVIKVGSTTNTYNVNSTSTIAVDSGTTGVIDAGDVVKYYTTVTNTGNNPIQSVNIQDKFLTSVNVRYSTSHVGYILPGQTVAYTATYVAKTEQLTTGSITVQPTVNVIYVACGCVVVPTNQNGGTVIVTQIPKDSLYITRNIIFTTDNGTKGKIDIGDVVEVTYAIYNNGKTTQNNVRLIDSLLTSKNKTYAPYATILPDASRKIIYTYTVTADDINGRFVTAPYAVSDTTVSNKVPAVTLDPAQPLAELPILKTTSQAILTSDLDGDGKGDIGDTVFYTYAVMNDGNVPFTNVGVTLNTGGPLDTPVIASMNPKTDSLPSEVPGSANSHVITQEDFDRGTIIIKNITATVDYKGQPISSTSVMKNIVLDIPAAPVTPTLEASIQGVASGDITLDKGTVGALDKDDQATFTVKLTNNGQVPLSNISIADQFLDGKKVSFTSQESGDLGIGASRTFTAKYTTTDEDVTYGSVSIFPSVTYTNTSDNKPTTRPLNPVTFLTAEPEVVVPDEWSVISSPMTMRVFHTSAIDGNDKIYAIGGKLASGPTESAETYDFKTNKWSKIADMNVPRYDHTTVTDHDGRVYAIGGYTTTSTSNSVERYDSTNNTWVKVPNMSTNRGNLASVVDAQGRIYAIGGYTGRGFTNTVERFDPATNTWETLASMGNARAGMTASIDANGRIYVVGGQITASTVTSTAEVYDPASNAWTALPNMPVRRMDHTATFDADGNLLIIGGSNSTSPALDSVIKYNVKTNTWDTLPSLAKGRTLHTTVTDKFGAIYAIGGKAADGDTNTVEKWDGNKWVAGTDMKASRYAHTTVVDSAGRVFAIGGSSSSEVLH